jgi:hypothetical protein
MSISTAITDSSNIKESGAVYKTKKKITKDTTS